LLEPLLLHANHSRNHMNKKTAAWDKTTSPHLREHKKLQKQAMENNAACSIWVYKMVTATLIWCLLRERWQELTWKPILLQFSNSIANLNGLSVQAEVNVVCTHFWLPAKKIIFTCYWRKMWARPMTKWETFQVLRTCNKTQRRRGGMPIPNNNGEGHTNCRILCKAVSNFWTASVNGYSRIFSW
jgi:hypothetical protein